MDFLGDFGGRSFWFLVEIPLVGIIVLLLGIIAGQIVRIPIGGGTIVVSDLILFAVIFAWTFKKIVKREALFIPNPINLPLIILDVIMALSLVWALVFLPRGEVISGSLYFFQILGLSNDFLFYTNLNQRHQTNQTNIFTCYRRRRCLEHFGFCPAYNFPRFFFNGSRRLGSAYRPAPFHLV